MTIDTINSIRNAKVKMLGVDYYNIFFFQAEDGIRYYKVTGVQTCALPIYVDKLGVADLIRASTSKDDAERSKPCPDIFEADRKSTRLNSSHLVISYAVFCLKKKKEQ